MMWLQLVEKSEALQAIYQNSIAELEKLVLKEIRIQPGEDTIITIIIDLTELPDKLPNK